MEISDYDVCVYCEHSLYRIHLSYGNGWEYVVTCHGRKEILPSLWILMQTEARYETPTEDGSVIDAYIRMTEDIRQLALLLHNMADRDDDFDNCTIEAVPKVLTPEEFAEHYPDIHEEEDEQ